MAASIALRVGGGIVARGVEWLEFTLYDGLLFVASGREGSLLTAPLSSA